MLALANTPLGNGMTSLAFAVLTLGATLALLKIKKLPAERARLRRIQLLSGVLAILILIMLPVALESFFRIWDPSYVYNGA
jgi:hypothetical protein